MGSFSKKLNSAKSNHSTFNRELLAAHSSTRHYCFMLEDWSFTLFMDQKTLISILIIQV